MSEPTLFEDQWSCELYDFQRSSGNQPDLTFWLELAKETGGPVCELACGSGPAMLPLARAGYQVVGLDLSPHMLAIAHRRLQAEPPEVRQRVRLLQGNMANFRLDGEFGLIFITNRSFQALLERVEQRSCLECCARHLRRGGLLAIDVFNPKLAFLVSPGGVDEGPHEYRGPGGELIRETGHIDYDLANQKLTWRVRQEATAPDGRVTPHEYVVLLRYYFRFELEWMLEACGFEVQAIYGNFDRSPFTAESPQIIFVASKQ